MDSIRSMRLQAVRCIECGDARWSLFSSADPKQPCELCGGEMRLERRIPGSGPRKLLRERRSAPVFRSRSPLTG
jgi:rRNA maturation endonuclease Nob1